MEEGYIKLNRKILSWEWYQDAATARLFLHCLLLANWKDARWQGVEVPRGSFLTGRAKLAQDLKISEQSVRTALKHLILTGELTMKTGPKGSIITVVNYDLYQGSNQQDNQQLTNEQPTTNQQLTNEQPTTNQRLTTNKNNNKYKNIKNIHEPAAPTEESKAALKEIERLQMSQISRTSEEEAG